jgi:hypothetical protein
MKQHIEILREIIDSHSHNIDISEAREAIEYLRDKLEDNETDFTFEFDGNEYRLIREDEIWSIYVEEIQHIIEDCYELNLDKIPEFVSVSIDWEQTAKNAYVDGYGHTFSNYDGSELEAGNYYIFRIN